MTGLPHTFYTISFIIYILMFAFIFGFLEGKTYKPDDSLRQALVNSFFNLILAFTWPLSIWLLAAIIL